MRFFVSTEPEIPKIYQRFPKIQCQSFRKTSENSRWLPKIAEDFLMTSEDNQRSRRIFNDFKTGRASNFQRISNQSQALFKSSEDVPDDNFSNVFKQLHSLLSVRREKLVWICELDHKFRSAQVRLNITQVNLNNAPVSLFTVSSQWWKWLE